MSFGPERHEFSRRLCPVGNSCRVELLGQYSIYLRDCRDSRESFPAFRLTCESLRDEDETGRRRRLHGCALALVQATEKGARGIER